MEPVKKKRPDYLQIPVPTETMETYRPKHVVSGTTKSERSLIYQTLKGRWSRLRFWSAPGLLELQTDDERAEEAFQRKTSPVHCRSISQVDNPDDVASRQRCTNESHSCRRCRHRTVSQSASVCGLGTYSRGQLRRRIPSPMLRYPSSPIRRSPGSNKKVHPLLQARRLDEQAFLPECDCPVFVYKNEHIYRGLLRNLLHPLGAPSCEIGLRPGDLIDHVREVFDIDREDHEFFIREELTNKPRCVQANVTVIEAKGLTTSDDVFSPYCVVTLYRPTKGIRGSPKTSPKNSPKTSPKLRRTIAQTPSIEQSFSTQVMRSTQPVWNEVFQLDLEDMLTDEIHIFLCDQEAENINDEPKPSGKHGISHLFRLARQMTDHEKRATGCLGRVIISIRDIPASGCDRWFDISALGSGSPKSKVIGQCHLKMDISYRQEEYEDGEYFSVEDYYCATQQVFQYVAKELKESGGFRDGILPTPDQQLLNVFAVSHQISKLSQTLTNVIVLLEWATRDAEVLSDQALPRALEALQMTWLTMQFDQHGITQKMPLTDAEIALYRKVAGDYISAVCDRLDDLPSLFPPSTEHLHMIKAKLGVTIQLLEIDLWESNSVPHNELKSKLLQKLQNNVNCWLDDKLQTISSHAAMKDAVLPEMTTFVDIVNMTSSHCCILGVVKSFYTSLDINYYRTVSFAVEKNITTKALELMYEMDKYQKRYHNYGVNIFSSSRLSLRLYFALRQFYSILKDNVSRRDVFRLTIAHYQQWFQESLVFWLQTFKTECTNRIDKALELDKDVVLVTDHGKYSTSSVDVLSCFAKVTEEWQQIGFQDPDAALMGVTKITDLICDGARNYADNIHYNLERNCYYDNHQGQFDVTERLCITLNNIEHVRKYLMELSTLLNWDSVVLLVSTKYENEEVGNQALSTLNRLTTAADKEILLKSSLLLQQITEKMKVDIGRYMEIFTRKEPEKLSSVDPVIDYLNTNLKTLADRLMSSIYPHMTQQLWSTIIRLFDDQLKVGQREEYYMQMKRHLRSLSMFFMKEGFEEDQMNTTLLDMIKTRLNLNSMNTEDLMLSYFGTLAGEMTTPTEYYGHLALKIAYMEETRGKTTIFVKVIRASDLPGLDSSGLSDPYVVVSLHPQTMFGHFKQQKTTVIEKTLHPVFNKTFQFANVPVEFLSTQGAVLLLSVMDYDHIGSDDFAGEVIIHLSSITKIGMDEGVDSRPVVMMPLKRPSNPNQGPFQVLEDRKSWDKTAKAFVNSRRHFIEKQPQRTDKPDSKTNAFFSFLNNFAC